MAETVDALRMEHANMARLLNMIEAQLMEFEAGRSLDFELLESVLDYFVTFPAVYHHPKEDLILERMKARDAAAAATFETLTGEHKLLASQVEQVANSVHLIEQDSIVSRDAFVDSARAFVAAQRRHMAFEEEAFLSAAERILDDSDWAAIDRHLQTPDDPLFGPAAAKEYQRLAEAIRV